MEGGWSGNTTIVNNIIKDTNSTQYDTGNRAGILVSEHCIVSNNRIINAYQTGIFIVGENNTISNNYIKGSHTYGIYGYSKSNRTTITGNFIEEIPGNSGIRVKRFCVITGNIIKNFLTQSQYGIHTSSDCTISNNIVAGGIMPRRYETGIYVTGKNCTVTNNRVKNASTGIRCDGNRQIVTGNYLFNASYNYVAALILSGAGNSTVSNNIINNLLTSNRGIQLASTDNTTVTENRVTEAQGGYGIYESTAGNFNIISENNLNDCNSPSITILGSRTVVRDNIGYKTESWGTMAIAASSGRITINTNMSCLPNTVYVTSMGNTTCVNGMEGFNATYTGTGGTYIVRIMCRGNLANACSFSWYVSNVTGGTRHNN